MTDGSGGIPLSFQVPPTLEVGLVPLLQGGQFPALFLFTTPARMMRPVRNLSTDTEELIGSLEQVGREGGRHMHHQKHLRPWDINTLS